MIKILTLAIVTFGIGYVYGANEILRIKTIKLSQRIYIEIVKLIKRLVAKIKGE